MGKVSVSRFKLKLLWKIIDHHRSPLRPYTTPRQKIFTFQKQICPELL